MGLRETLKDNPLIIVAGVFAAGISIGWSVSNAVLVGPRDFEITQLQKEVGRIASLRQDLTKSQEALSNFRKEVEIVQGIFEVFSDTFDEEVLTADQPVLVLFTASWAPPSLKLIPNYLEVYSEYRGRLKFVWIRLEKSSRMFQTYEITTVPQLALFKQGKIVDTSEGFLSKKELVGFVDKNL